MNFSYYIFLLLFLLCRLIIYSQPNKSTTYSLADGLIGNNIQKIIQDKNGFIWFITWDGLCRYDGSRFSHFASAQGMPINLISDIVEIEPDTMLVALWRNTLMKVTEGALLSGTQYSHAQIHKFIIAMNGQKLALSLDSGILKWEKGKYVPIDPQNPLKLDNLHPLNDSQYIANENNGIWLLDKNFKTIGPKEPEPKREFLGFFYDKKKNSWVGTNNGLKRVDNKQRQGTPVLTKTLPQWMANTPVETSFTRALLQDKEGKYWVGNDAGLFYFDSSGLRYHFHTGNGLPTNIVTCIMQDREENIWVGTSTGAVKIALKNHFRIIKASDGLPVALGHNHLQIDNQSALLFSKSKSLIDLRLGKIKPLEIYKPDWRHYGTSENEVVVLRDGYAEIYHKGKSEPVKRKWNGSTQPLIVKRLNHDTYFLGNLKGFEIESPRACISDTLSIPYRIAACEVDNQGNLWIGTWSHGVYYLKMSNENGKLKWQVEKVPDSLFLDIEVRSIYIDKFNRIWVGSRRGGVVSLKKEKDRFVSEYAFSSRNKLSSDFIHVIKGDPKNNLWLGTGHGLVKFIPTDTGYRAFNFSRLHQTPIGINNITFLHNNWMMASGIDGLIIARDDQVDTLPPSASFITEILTPYQSDPVIKPNGFTLSHNNPNIIFHFTSPVFFNEKMVGFSYRLLNGRDTTWLETNNDRSVNFANLKPGQYLFQIRARGWNDAWGEPDGFAFKVSKPFWQKGWFFIICTGALGLLFYAFYRYRINQIIKIHKVRDSIAADLHDEIGSILTNINILASLTQRNLGVTQRAEDFLKRISEETVATQHSLDDIIWSVNKDNDSMESTIWRMRRYAAELFDETGVLYNIEMDNVLQDVRLVMQQRRDFYLLFKEAVNNIAKHARATKVEIDIKIFNQMIEMKISDNGTGFTKDAVSDRNGIKTMESRVNKWNGNFTINSNIQQGTQITIILPIARN